MKTVYFAGQWLTGDAMRTAAKPRSHRKPQAVVGKLHTRRQSAIGVLVFELVGHMGEVGPARANTAGHLHGLGNAQVRRMGIRPQGVQNQHLKASQQSQRFVRNMAAIRAIGEAPEAKAQHRHRPVHQRDGYDGFIADGERLMVDAVQFQLRTAVRRIGGRLESVCEHAANALQRPLRAIAWHRLLHQPVESAKVVQSRDVVRVMMRKQHGVHGLDPVGQALQTQFGRCIDQNPHAAEAHENAGTGPPVAGIIGSTNRASAADHRHAVRRAAAQNNYFEGGFLLGHLRSWVALRFFRSSYATIPPQATSHRLMCDVRWLTRIQSVATVEARENQGERTMAKQTVAVIGASNDRTKFSNKAVRAYVAQGWDVYPVNPKGGEIEGLKVYTSIEEIPAKIDRVTTYLPPSLGIKVLPAIAAVNPLEFFVNPGAESEELVAEAKSLGLDPILACSIVDLGVSPAQFPGEPR